MDWPRVKTIMIVILLLVNLIVGGLFLYRNLESVRENSEMAADSAAALDRLGVKVNQELLMRKTAPIYTLEVKRDEELERSAFAALIGDEGTEVQGGVNIVLAGNIGKATLKSSGRFEMTLNGSERIAVTGSDIESAREILSRMGAASSGDSMEQVPSASGYAVQGTQKIKGREVFNEVYLLRFDDLGLYGMDGGMLLGKPLICDTTPSVSVITALFAFVGAMDEMGTPCKEIRDAELGYYAESSAPGYTQLIPVWKINSDLRTYYVSAVTLDLISDLPN